MIALSNGDDLHITIGKETHDAFMSMLTEESIDDVIDEVIEHGASANNNQTPDGSMGQNPRL